MFAAVLDGTDLDNQRALEQLAVLLVRHRPGWHLIAACHRSELDFTDLHHRRAALSVCNGCAVRAQCLEWAIDLGDDIAILGGTTPAERAVIISERAA